MPRRADSDCSYESLKSAIYRFEKANLVAGPPTAYSDHPVDLESATTEIHLPSTNEKTFVRLLDKELRRITDFYVEKERELLADLEMLRADIERIEEEDAHFSTGGQSGDSDEDEDDDESLDGSVNGVAKRKSRIVRGALETVFATPANYEAATRAGRKAKTREPSNSRSNGDGGSISDSKRAQRNRSRGYSHGSDAPGHSGDELLDIPQSTRSNPASPARFHHGSVSKRKPGNMRRSSRMGMSTTSGHFEDDDEGLGIWGSHSDWAIDTKIMYKRRVTAVFTVRPLDPDGLH